MGGRFFSGFFQGEVLKMSLKEVFVLGKAFGWRKFGTVPLGRDPVVCLVRVRWFWGRRWVAFPGESRMVLGNTLGGVVLGVLGLRLVLMIACCSHFVGIKNRLITEVL